MARKRNKRVSHPHWRPDFRDVVLLPDIKVVRTQFLSVFLTLTIAVALLGWLLFNEYGVRLAQSELATVRAEVAASRAENAELVRLSGEFTREARHVEELQSFLDLPYDYHEILVVLAEIRPRAVTYNHVSGGIFAERQGRREVRRYRLQLQGTVRESAENPAPATINRFRDRLSAIPVVAMKLEEQRLSSFYRTDDPTVFNFVIQIVLDPDKAGGGS
ncbi:MAG: hypothetical protein JJU00_12010 [Opitutales bacterium]|nr:hypothetical protein [Opitutales bacterium]